MKRYELPIISIVSLFLLSIHLDNRLLQWLSLMLALILIGVRWWNRYTYRHLAASVQFDQSRIFPEDMIQAELILENHGYLPIFNLKVEFSFWGKGTLESSYFRRTSQRRNWAHFQGDFFLGSKEKLRIPLTIHGSKRGVNSIRDLTLKYMDPLGVGPVEKGFHFFEEILVYPLEKEIDGLAQINRMPQGDTVVKRWIQEDIFFPVGARPYQSGDSFSRIDFKATAKLQKLHTKLFDYTAHGDICVITNLLTNERKWLGVHEEFLENSLSLAARLARESLQKQLRFSLIINAQVGKGKRVYELPSGIGKMHYRKTLEALARFSHHDATPFSLALNQAKLRYPGGVLTVVITSYLDETIERELDMLALKGFEIYLLNPADDQHQLKRWDPFLAKAVEQYG